MLLVLPADHLVADEEAFAAAVGQAMKLAAHGRLVTFGIRRAADVSAQKVKLNGAEGSTFELVAGSVMERVTFPLVG